MACNTTKHLINEQIAGNKVVTVDVRNFSTVSYQVVTSCATPSAQTFGDSDICLCTDNITMCCHGFKTGIKGVLTSNATATSTFVDECVCLTCDCITEACHGIITGEKGVLASTKGAAKAFVDTDVCLTCDCITETTHGYTEGERGQFSFTIGCAVAAINGGDICLTCDCFTLTSHGFTDLERVQISQVTGCAITFNDSVVCLTCDCITSTAHGFTLGKRVAFTHAAGCAVTFDDGDVSVACDSITITSHGLDLGQSVALTHAAGCAATFRDGGVSVACDQITLPCHGLVTGSQVAYTVTNSTCAKTFLEAGVCLTCDQITSCAHGFATGQKGQLTLAIGCAMTSIEGDITFACNTFDQPCIALILSQRVNLTVCNGCAATGILDECYNVCTEVITSAGHGLLVGQRGQFTVTIGCAVGSIVQSTDICTTCDTITSTSHGLTDLERGQVTSTCALPAGLCACTNYFVIKTDCNTFQLATSRSNAVCNCAIDITTAGSGTMTFTPNGILPTGVALATNYYLICVNACNFKISATQGGAAVNATALNGPASMVFTPNGILPVALTACCCYFLACVVTGACGTFKLAATSGGAAIGLTDNNGGIGTYTFTPNGILPTGVTVCTDYFIIKVDCNTVSLASTQANAVACTAIALTAKNGGGTMTFTGSGAVVTGLSACCCYNVIRVDGNTIQLATSVANALACTQIDLTAIGGAALNTLTPGGAVPTGLCACCSYFVTFACVCCPTANVFQLASSSANALAGTQIDLTALAGSTIATLTPDGAVPTGLCACTCYFVTFACVCCETANVFQLASTEANAVAGTQINITGLGGAGTMTLTPNGVLPTGLAACTNYFIIKVDCNTIQLATTRANAVCNCAINITAIAGASPMTITPNGALPTGVSACTNYFVIKVDCNTYKVATTRALAVAACPTPVTLTAVNSPATQTFTPNGTVPTGLAECCTYYAIATTASTYKLASSHANALAGTEIDLTALNGAASMTFNSCAAVPCGLCACGTYFIINTATDTVKFASSLVNAEAGTKVNITAKAGASNMTFTACTCTAAVVSWKGSNDGTNFACIPCYVANKCITCAAHDTVSTEASIAHAIDQVTIAVTEGQIEVDLIVTARI